MRTILIGGAFCLIGAAALACQPAEDAVELSPDRDDAPDGFIQLASPPVSAPFPLSLWFCDAADLIDVKVTAIMPAHQHGMNYEPEVTFVTEEIVQVDGMVFHMPGEWQIQIDVVDAVWRAAYTYDIVVK